MFVRGHPSNIARSRLLLAKRAYLLAGNLRTNRDDPAGRIAAIVLYDFSIETIMKLAVETLGNARVARDFPAVLNQLDEGLTIANLPPLTMRRLILYTI